MGDIRKMRCAVLAAGILFLVPMEACSLSDDPSTSPFATPAPTAAVHQAVKEKSTPVPTEKPTPAPTATDTPMPDIPGADRPELLGDYEMEMADVECTIFVGVRKSGRVYVSGDGYGTDGSYGYLYGYLEQEGDHMVYTDAETGGTACFTFYENGLDIWGSTEGFGDLQFPGFDGSYIREN